MLRKLLPKRFRKDHPVVAVLRLAGTIGVGAPLRTALTLDACAPSIERAFSLRGVSAVALAINSPGGSPVQSRLIFRRIRDLAEEKSIPVFAFAEDVAASGGYMLACAGDEIYADPSSIIGSIGVVSSGFGFVEAIEKLGVERRVHTAGKRKALLDPFQPERKADVVHLKSIQGDIHKSFKDLVRDRREGRFHADEDELFSGEFWAGEKALEMGLIDGIGDLRAVIRSKYGENVQLRAVSQQKSWLKRRLSLGGSAPGERAFLPAITSGLAEDALAAIEARALWSRFGL